MHKIRSTDEDDSNAYKNRNFKMTNDLWLRIFYACLIGAMVMGIYRTRIEAMGEEQKVQACELIEQDKRVSINEKDLVCLKTELPNIKKDVCDIKNGMNEIQKDIKLLLQR